MTPPKGAPGPVDGSEHEQRALAERLQILRDEAAGEGEREGGARRGTPPR